MPESHMGRARGIRGGCRVKALSHFARVSEEQVSFGDKLGLDLRGCAISVATARVEDAIDIGFRGVVDLGSPTSKQVALAAKFGSEISHLSRREGEAVIDDLMTQLNLETIEAEGLAPEVVVTNIHDDFEEHYVISSIKPDGTVYLRGGNGRRAWARSLRRVPDASPAGGMGATARRRIGR